MIDFEKMEKAMWITTVLSIILSITASVLIAWGAIYCFKTIKEKGLKNCIESIWNGTTTNSIDTIK